MPIAATSSSVARAGRTSPVARVRSWLGDWAVVCLWLAVLTLVGLVVRAVIDLPPMAATPSSGDLLRSDLLITVATVLPYVAYLALTETSARHATLGKRWAGLVVTTADGGAPSTGAVWLRNVVKALPWQLAHLGVSRAILEVQTPWAMSLTLGSLILLAACAVPSLLGGRGIHDRLAGTRVQGVPPA
ncbi:RDD family protein [Ornithinimicrobium cryptoxanthini]|uniref:RDD family protein n=1 Tax=Ornithinimicrobium cryptoxanthini TaxID=2934161 RepID=A0ABY4YHX2_9MICO|nr:RDD family protein [Ornithinimicrobium cryptoxanthini]USQ76390.1 RDD family protein [Ornithinimicrobium cryptoxanthini]